MAGTGSASVQYYAVGEDHEVPRRFRIFLRSGEVYSFSYSLLPVFILTAASELIIKSHELFIRVQGRNLTVLEQRLSEESLLFIRESPSGRDDGESTVFVSQIEIQGASASKYPEE